MLAGPRSEPEPDLALLRAKPDFYAQRHPGPGDVLLVVEVADSSLDYDHAKPRIYAAAGMPEIWIVDLQAERVEIHRGPGPAGYGDVRFVRRDETIACLAFPDITLTVADILG